jgi:hypothetical protein
VVVVAVVVIVVAAEVVVVILKESITACGAAQSGSQFDTFVDAAAWLKELNSP